MFERIRNEKNGSRIITINGCLSGDGDDDKMHAIILITYIYLMYISHLIVICRNLPRDFVLIKRNLYNVK